ncbi:MAG: response regulator [Myxococcota bacterium]
MSSEVSSVAPPPKPKVLIVEDERIIAKDIAQTLEGMGYQVAAIAASAEEAVAQAESGAPDVILMDIRIQGPRDGIVAAGVIRERLRIPVVFMTAHADDATLDRAKRTEPYGYLVKPVKSAELRSAIEVSLYRHQMERRLRERERWFATTLGSLADGVIAVDLEGKVTFMNPAAERLTQIRLEAAAGRPISEVVQLAGASPPVLEQLELALRERRTSAVREAELRLAVDRSLLVSNNAAPVLDEEQLLGAVIVLRDITENRALERKLEETARLASLGTMAAGVAHEINNPLSALSANASFVLDEILRLDRETGSLSETVAAQREILASTARIASIVADLRAFSRPEKHEDSTADVRRAIDWALHTSKHQIRPRARLEVEIGELPRGLGDETRLGQVFVNLLVNAAQAISPGNADGNRVRLSAQVQEDRWIVVEISDSGAGMSEATQRRIFEPFFTTKSPGEGTGLGLSICHGILSAIGGSIHVRSAPGEGTSFEVRIPVAAAKSIAPPLTQAEGMLRGRILIVDDEVLVRRALSRALRAHELVVVERGQECLDLLGRGERFDMILTDLIMPTMMGDELYQAIEARYPDHAARVVFMSGGAISTRIEEFLVHAKNHVVQKPFVVRDLLAMVDRLLRSARQG